jgi:hypothetical protein
MAFPTPESLIPGIAALERAIAVLEASEAAKQRPPVTSGDGNFSATATADVGLFTVTFTDNAFLTFTPEALASGMLQVCGPALADAAAISAADAAAAAANYSLPGVPGINAPPFTDAGFDLTVGAAIAAAPALSDAIRQLSFEATQANVRAVVTGALELTVLEYALPMPGARDALESATVGAINAAIAKAKNLFDPTTRRVIDVATGAAQAHQPDLRPKALLVVENAASLRTSDELLRARLSSLGFDVEVRKAPSSATVDANGRTLIVVSESVTPSDVGTKFVNAAVPLVALEPQQFRDLKMTSTVSGTDFGEATGQTQLTITAGHALAAGLSGNVTVVKAASKLEWGKPATAAIKVATIVGKSSQFGIFAYDTGDAMVGANAPSRRVGFFAGQDTPANLNDNGWKLFDAAVRWATAAKALFTAQSTTLGAPDLVLKQRLEDRHRLEVTVRSATDTRTSDLFDFRVHVISDSVVNAADVGARFLTSPAPTVNCEAALHDDMKMTGTTQNSDFGTTASQTDLDIATPAHPLAAGLSGRVTVVSSPQTFGWGKPGAEAVKVATLVGQPNQACIFAYESGANMVGTRAPAPRVGFFAEGNVASALTPPGLALFDAAIRWARRPRALLVVGAIPLRASDEAMRARLEKVFGFVVDVQLATGAVDKIAAGKRLVVLSESSAPADVGSKLTSLAVPVLALAPAIFDDLKMTGTTQNTDFGEASGQTDIEMVKVDHPLAAGLATGPVTVATSATKFGWGKPAAAAVMIARVVGKSSQWTIFGYESGATMVGANAPARRVGWFAERDDFVLLNDNGLRLFDAAVLWAAGRLEFVPQLDDLGDVVGGIGGNPGMSTWRVGVFYRVGDQVTFQGAIYRCRQAHTSQIDWQPPLVFALWERMPVDDNWVVQVMYKVGDQVNFQGQRYQCLQAHQSQSDWQPPVVPALWQKIS